MNHGAVFVDWLSISQLHPKGGLPVLVDGVTAQFDAGGNCRYEFGLFACVPGSFDTSVRVRCDGFRVSLSGNPGRFGRPDNLFNLGWLETLAACGRILADLGLPAFTAASGLPDDRSSACGSRDGRSMETRGAVVSRVDLTCNYRTGSDAQARAVIRWLAGRSVARMKRGFAGDESVWFSNSRHMLKAYRKGEEMKKHGGEDDASMWATDHGIVRVEVELKKRLLSEMNMNDISEISDQRLQEIFEQQTEIFRRVDMSDEPDILANIPSRSRAYAAAWLAGQDVRMLTSRATLFRHAKVLRSFGLDILEPRNVASFPIKVRVVDLEPLSAPDWHWTRAA